jgi:type I site-specific restriction endonuclease
VSFPATASGRQRTEGAGVRLAKGVLLWNETRRFVAGQINSLQQVIVKETQDDPDYDEIIANLTNLDVVMEHLDDRLTEKLGEIQAESDPSAKSKLSDQARKIITDMQAYVAADELMADIDDNGFTQTAIKPRVEQTLAAILETI